MIGFIIGVLLGTYITLMIVRGRRLCSEECRDASAEQAALERTVNEALRALDSSLLTAKEGDTDA